MIAEEVYIRRFHFRREEEDNCLVEKDQEASRQVGKGLDREGPGSAEEAFS